MATSSFIPKVTIFNFVPAFCPSCGCPLSPDPQAFFGGCSEACSCGLFYQVADSDTIINAAAESGGDLECQLFDLRPTEDCKL